MDPLSDEAPPKIYVAYCDEDFGIAKYIVGEIEKEGTKCYFKDRDEGTGYVLDQLCEKSWSCRLVLLIYSEHSLKDSLIKFLQIQSLQNTVDSNQLTLMFLLHEIDEKNLPLQVRFVPHIHTSEEDYVQKLIGQLKAPSVSLNHLLPVGNISSGLVWGFYYGYLELVLPRLPARIDEWIGSSSEYKRIPRRLYLLLPTPANIVDCLTKADDSIEFVETIETLVTNQAGIIKRKYQNSIYKISKDGKEYYFAAEYATPLKTMFKIRKGQLAGLTEIALRKQVELFKVKLTEILNHKESPSNSCTLVIYDDVQSLSDLLVKEIENDLRKENDSLDGSVMCLPTPGQEMDPHSDEAPPEIYVAYCDEDFGIAEYIVGEIEKEGTKCYFKDRDEGNGYVLDQLCEKSWSCRLVLLIYSEHSLKEGLMKYFTMQSLYQMVKSEESKILFLLHDFDESKLPSHLKVLPHVLDSEQDYLKTLMKKLKAPSISMDYLLPVGDVSSGLAWSFYYGYLELILPHIPQKINEWVGRNPSNDKRIPRWLYILLPIDAYCPGSISEADASIEYVETFTTLCVDQASNKERFYQNAIYKINKPHKEYYFAAEYATPLKTMFQMEKGQLAGLTKIALRKQVELFKVKFTEILSHKDCPYKCCTLLIYDDKQSLSELLVKEIEKVLNETEMT